ncbi:MAG: CarD family transcriptional regulator, partial [Acidimicrobiales bacterium]
CGMVLSVPEAGAAALGVRPAVSEAEASEVLEVLEDHHVHVPSNWSRRFKNHQEKLKTGDVYQCAEVVRNLAVRARDRPMSAGERTMYAKARYILTSELAVSWQVDDAAAGARVDKALAPREPSA